jgi:hypothetical protein
VAKAFNEEVRRPHLTQFSTCLMTTIFAHIASWCLPDLSSQVLRTMSELNDLPLIFPLSNPTSKSECTFAEAMQATGGRCVFASGSPFPPYQIDDRIFIPGQVTRCSCVPTIDLCQVPNDVCCAVLCRVGHLAPGEQRFHLWWYRAGRPRLGHRAYHHRGLLLRSHRLGGHCACGCCIHLCKLLTRNPVSDLVSLAIRSQSTGWPAGASSLPSHPSGGFLVVRCQSYGLHTRRWVYLMGGLVTVLSCRDSSAAMAAGICKNAQAKGRLNAPEQEDWFSYCSSIMYSPITLEYDTR